MGKKSKDKTKDAFKKVGRDMKNGFKKVGDKMMQQFKTIERVFECIGKIFKALGSQIKCGFDKIASLPSCFLYYFLDVLFFIKVTIPVWFIGLFVPPIWAAYRDLGKTLLSIDDMIYKNINVHVFRYQDSVINRCYRCKNLIPYPKFNKLGSCDEKPKEDPNARRPLSYEECQRRKRERNGIPGSGAGPYADSTVSNK
jgi:hypothetical protein